MILNFKEMLNEEIPKSEIVKLEKYIYNLQNNALKFLHQRAL
jgi:hypothetical protein